METDCQHLLERHRSQRKIPGSGAKQGEKKVAESVSPLFVVDKKANIQAFDQKGIQRNKEVKSVLNELKHSVFKAQDFSRPKLCFNATLKLVLQMQIASVFNAKGLLFAHKNKITEKWR